VIEFLQPFVEVVARALPSIAKKKERDDSAALGAELFLVYVQFNEALVLAEEIVASLETYVERMNDDDGFAPAAGSWISAQVHQQLRNLVGIGNRIDRWKWELQVLDGQSTNNLRFLLSRKMSGLKVLSKVTGEDRFSLRTSGVLIDDQGVLGPRWSTHEYLDNCRELSHGLRESSVRMDETWGPDVLVTVEEYLARRRPREQLDEIRQSLERIRAALEANFTVQDILLRAGDPRANPRHHMW
jgi:exonuclease VII small subunit